MKPLSVLFLLAVSPVVCLAETPMREQAEAALQKGVAYFHSISRHGGYVYYVTTDLKLRWGESPADENTIEVQPPGTPAVGMSFLRAFKATADSRALQAAKDAAFALIDGMNALDGWDHTIDFNNVERKSVSFDDNQSQSAVSFLMALDQQIDDERLSQATQRAIAMMMRAQLPNGGWPHRYPEQGNYHDYATFNDGGINDCVRVMIEARNYYPENHEITVSLKKAARFLEISQLPPPQP
ncbi:MAG: hypothetical protein KDB22_21985, partial [Planctomycetales bacterium]|nr:hypothetical protein [Planctomycetales bacterium]